jgi:hypothetical protein
MHWIIPRNVVIIKTRIATQKVYHWTPFRRSCHHWDKVRGVASSYACFRITRRSLQKLKRSIWRSCVFRLPQSASLESSTESLCFSRSAWYHFRLEPPPILPRLRIPNSCCGNNSANVQRVSSMNPSGKIDLIKVSSIKLD